MILHYIVFKVRSRRFPGRQPRFSSALDYNTKHSKLCQQLFFNFLILFCPTSIFVSCSRTFFKEKIWGTAYAVPHVLCDYSRKYFRMSCSQPKLFHKGVVGIHFPGIGILHAAKVTNTLWYKANVSEKAGDPRRGQQPMPSLQECIATFYAFG